VSCKVTAASVWPANHKLVAATATVTVKDELSGDGGFKLDSVKSDEPDAGIDREDVPNDIQDWTLGTADVSGRIRAERDDKRNGRTYTWTYVGRDAAGNSTSCTATVVVPRVR
jgi:hypothetical protein